MGEYEAQKTHAKYCLRCGYALQGLQDARCPECGKEFDPRDATTFSSAPLRVRKMPLVLAMYLVPLTLSSLFWIRFEVNWMGHVNPPSASTVVRTVSLQACGPFAWYVNSLETSLILPLCTLIWITWFAVVCGTRVRKLPYTVQLMFGFSWCLMGSLIMATRV
jgi:predicted RNA-binding Zn-ribbon protein involved in translation (DUF1610 family)